MYSLKQSKCNTSQQMSKIGQLLNNHWYQKQLKTI